MTQLALVLAPPERAPSATVAARKRRDRGMARAADHAGAEWARRAEGYLREFIALGNRGPFLCEDVRAFAEAHGCPTPPTGRAWGPVMQQAKRDGIVAFHDYAPANSSNGSPKVRWIAP